MASTGLRPNNIISFLSGDHRVQSECNKRGRVTAEILCPTAEPCRPGLTGSGLDVGLTIHRYRRTWSATTKITGSWAGLLFWIVKCSLTKWNQGSVKFKDTVS